MAEISQELEKEELSSEQKRLLKEMLNKLYEKLKDIDGLEKLTQVVQKAQKTDLSTEAMRELISALDRVSPRSADNNSVGKVSEQLEEARKQVARIGIKSGNNQTQKEGQIETGLNTAAEGAPGDNTISGMDESGIDEYMSGEGYDTELEGQVDESGKSVSVDMIEKQGRKKATVPYSEIYMEYRDAADENISRNSIPWTYRKHVKDYFDAIKPKERSDGN
ncbi:hypothetical protein GF312_20800 [Candidatus Poribacteria bacterium]|nr:hypothetical protein [Candidatus Poribacteria bacterium]